MGCLQSKNVQDSHKIDFNMDTTKFWRADDTFREAGNILRAVETLRSGIEDSRENAIKQSNCNLLKEPKFSEAIRVLFWAVSGGYGGEIKKSEIDILSVAPYLRINCGNLLYETYQLNSCLNTYLKTLTDGPLQILELIPKLEELVVLLEELVPNVKNEAANSGLGIADSAKAALASIRNLRKIRESVPKVKRVKEVIENAVQEILPLMEKMKEYAETADVVGSEAFKANVLRPKDIFDKYHPGPKLTPEEIAATQKKK